MAVFTALTVGAIVVGGLVAIGTGVAVGVANSDSNIKDKIADLKAENKTLNAYIEYFTNIKSNLSTGKQNLNDSKTAFTNGGHVLDGVPLANDKFNDCISIIDDTISGLNNIISKYKTQIENNKKEIKKLEAKLE